MKTTITKKAKLVIDSFSNREKKLFDYLNELLSSDNKNFKDLEIARIAGDDAQAIKTGYLLVFRMNERALYIMQCLGIHGNLQNYHLIIDVL